MTELLLIAFGAALVAAVARDYRNMFHPRSRSSAAVSKPGSTPRALGTADGRAGLRSPRSMDAAQERQARSLLRTGSADVTPHGSAGPVTQLTPTIGGEA